MRILNIFNTYTQGEERKFLKKLTVKLSLVDNKVVLVPTTCEIIYYSTYGILIEKFLGTFGTQ